MHAGSRKLKPSMEGFQNLRRGAPVSPEGGVKCFSWQVIDWEFGWLCAATYSVPANLRKRGALIIAACALALIENQGPRRAAQLARALSGATGESIRTASLCTALAVPDPAGGPVPDLLRKGGEDA